MLRYFLFAAVFFQVAFFSKAQTAVFSGQFKNLVTEEPLPFVQIQAISPGMGFAANEKGYFSFQAGPKPLWIKVFSLGFFSDSVLLKPGVFQTVFLKPLDKQLGEVVVSGHLNERLKSESVMPIETYTPVLFKKTWAPNLTEALQLVNGVQTQISCNVCAAPEIRIHGLDGPYTMVLIDGMPIMSSLSAVYGLAGIPSALLKRVEITKGPASALYGSEAMAGTINIITRDPLSSPRFSADVSATSIGETNADFSAKWKKGRASSLLGINMFHYGLPKDMNHDGFADIALQSRVSVFSKWNFERQGQGRSSLAVRLFGEDRMGGQINYGPRWVSGDSVYGESIKTRRVEILGTQSLDKKGKWRLDYALNTHRQDSWYGTNRFESRQNIAFGQLIFTEKRQNLSLVGGLPLRLLHYDDNTPITGSSAVQHLIPGIFAQADYQLSPELLLLGGIRFDRHPAHGLIFTPRTGLRWKCTESGTLRISGGSGFREVNLFAEDHAALSGSRQVIILENLMPEKSWNVNASYEVFINGDKGFSTLEINAFYTRFSNRINADFLTDPDKVIYDNLRGYAVSQGMYVNYSLQLENGFRAMAGLTWMDVYQMERRNTSSGGLERNTQLLAPALSGTFSLSCLWKKWNFDLTGRISGPMKMPVLQNDFRPEYSPVVPLIHFQVRKSIKESWECYAGIRNLLNRVSENPIMRPFDPFDKKIDQNNPQGYTFDTGYHYAPMQGSTFFLGVRYHLD
jgi:outer membrane receptor for ferrienterochelin and colicins